MPDPPPPKHRLHPWRTSAERSTTAVVPAESAFYAELQVTSNFTFLTGGSHPEELVERAAELGYRALAITDENSLAGIVRAHVAAKEAGLALVVGCHLVFGTGAKNAERSDASVLVYPTDRASYGRLCTLLTLGRRRAPKGECQLELEDLFEHESGLFAVVLPPGSPSSSGDPALLDPEFEELVRRLALVFDRDRLSLALHALLGPDDEAWRARLAAIGRACDVPLVAMNDVHYHVPERRALQDALTCIREHCTLDEAGLRLFSNGERYLKSRSELERLFHDCPEALERTVHIAERASAFCLDELRYEYPDEISPPGVEPMDHLVERTWKGAAERYPEGVPNKVAAQLEHEFRLIEELDYASYFLTVYDIVRFAQEREILCQGRGAAANSAVCYCLGITAVDPDRIEILFERFVSKERDEPPDIDVDFEHERREEVIQYIYEKYGRNRAALTGVVISYRGRSAIRDVGKVVGLSLDAIDRLAKDLDWWHKDIGVDRLRALGLDPSTPAMKRFLTLLNAILGFPRHLSQHVGGFVITRGPLCELVPIENASMPDRTVIEWDKDDIDAMGMLKVDILGLGILTAVRKCIELINDHARETGAAPEAALAFHRIPAEDPAVYDMLCEADTVGVFQIESRAQMSMLPRLRPREFYDLVIEVAIVRPGPIQGKMVHPYLRRRNGEEAITYPNAAVERVLSRTLGVPLFQEQVMALSMVAGGFTPGEADELRRAMAAWKRKSGRLEVLCRDLMAGLVRNGYSAEFSQRLYDQIMGFGEYGFPESHAASFSLIVYVTAWLKRYHPAAFTSALINSQPMGFYAPAQLVRDARDHGVEVRVVDVNKSEWDCTLEATESGAPPALRLGMRLVKGLSVGGAEAVAEAVATYGELGDVESLQRRSGARVAALRRLAYADAFQSMGLDRQRALWEVRALRDDVSADLWATPESQPPPSAPRLPGIPLANQVRHDYSATTLSLKAHPVSFVRKDLEKLGVTPAALLYDEALFPNGRPASTAGLVLVRQRPGTANGVVFMTLEDETGVSNLILRGEVFDRYRTAARHASVVLARGRIERAEGVVYLMVRRVEGLDGVVGRWRSRDFH